MTDDFQRYLRAKRTVDDRALDRRLVDDLRDRLAARATGDEPLSVLDVGAGIGTMLTRFWEWDLLPDGAVRYAAVDRERASVAECREYVRSWAADRDVTVSGDDPLVLTGPDRRVELRPVVADAFDAAADASGRDLLVGAALLDVVDRSRMPVLLGALAPGGLYYFPITFDGATRFLPAHPADRAVERRYHEHMDTKPGGSSRAGGETLARLQRLDGVDVDAAGSDWVVTPVDGAYRADEAFLLRHILDTVETAVGEVTGGGFPALDDWLASRRAAVEACDLSYHTHQLDLLGTVADPTALDGDG